MVRQLIAFTCIAMLLPFSALSQKKGGKKRADPPVEIRLAERIGRVRSRLAAMPGADDTARALERSAGRLLDEADNRLRAGQFLESDQLSRAAEALARSIEHVTHALDPSRGRFLSREGQTLRIEKAYFWLQQSEYFAKHAQDVAAKDLAAIARGVYQRAQQAYLGGNAREVDEFAKACEEIATSIEHMARSALPMREAPRLK
jgi:methyl-accepting chemotaxis protein